MLVLLDYADLGNMKVHKPLPSLPSQIIISNEVVKKLNMGLHENIISA